MKMKTPIAQLINQLEMTVPAIKNGNAIDKEYWIELERQWLLEFWIDGNNKGWDMSTDWPESAQLFYDNKFNN